MNLHFAVPQRDTAVHIRMRSLTVPVERSAAVGPDYRRLLQGVEGRLAVSTAGLKPSSGIPCQSGDLEGSLFENKATSKIAVGKLAMHLSSRYRSKLFSEIDRLLDIENWDDDSSLLDARSLETFLRAVLFNRIAAIPSLGVSRGRLLASWRSPGGAQRLHVEFLPDDRVKVLLTTAGPTKTSDETAVLVAPSKLLRERLIGLGLHNSVLNAA